MFAEPYISPVISYPCYIQIWQHLKGAKAQIKIRRLKVETRRRRDSCSRLMTQSFLIFVQPVVIQSSTRHGIVFLCATFGQHETNIQSASSFNENMLKAFWEQTGDNRHVFFTKDTGSCVRLDMFIFDSPQLKFILMGSRLLLVILAVSYLLARFLSLKFWSLSFLLYHSMHDVSNIFAQVPVYPK